MEKGQALDIRIVIAGHVDHGKSTLIGRLLSDTHQIFPERIEKVKNICEKNGKRFEFAFLLDALEEEQNQGITIDKTEIAWTYKGKNFLIIDTPGHKEFLKNMISGASTADIALIMLDAEEGIREQFTRHAYLFGMLGIKNIVIIINKIDIVDYSESIFEKLKNEALIIFEELKLKAYSVIPLSAFNGDNLVDKSSKLPWYRGDTLADTLLKMTSEKKENTELRFSLQDTYKYESRIYVGKVESGSLNIGDLISFSPSQSHSKIKSIETWSTDNPQTVAFTGSSVGFTLEDPLYLERGEIGFKTIGTPPVITHQIHASLFWISAKPLSKEKNYKFKLLTQEVDCKVESIFNVFNPQEIKKSNVPEVLHLQPAEAGEIIIKLKKSISCDAFINFENTGRFVLLDENQIVGGGIIISPNSIQVFREQSLLKPIERTEKSGHRGAVLWLTGLSGSGKSTIAKLLEKRLFEKNIHSVILDGDNLRKGINKDLGFSNEDRKENIRRTSEIAKIVAESGSIAIACLISPFEYDRQLARSINKEINFLEVFISCPLEICEKRDSKGLYKKARNGEIKSFTGIDSPYESPLNPEITINTNEFSAVESVDLIISYLTTKDSLRLKKK